MMSNKRFKLLSFTFLFFFSSTIYGSTNFDTQKKNQGLDSPLSYLQSVPTGQYPVDIKFSPSGKMAAVANVGDNTVSIYSVSGTTGKLSILQTIKAGLQPYSLAFSPTGKMAAVANGGDSTVSVYSISGTTGKFSILQTINTGQGPCSIAFSQTGKIAAVSFCSGGRDVAYIYGVDVNSGLFTRLQTISPPNPVVGGHVVISSSTNIAAIVTNGGVLVYSINPQNGWFTLIQNITDYYSGSLGISVGGNLAAIGESFLNNVAIYSISAQGQFSKIQDVSATGGGNGVSSIAFEPHTKLAAVILGSLTVYIYGINGTTGQFTQVQSIEPGTFPDAVAFSPSGTLAAITNFFDNTIAVYGIRSSSGNEQTSRELSYNVGTPIPWH